MGKYRVIPAKIYHVALICDSIAPEIVRELEALSSEHYSLLIRKNIEGAMESWSVFYNDRILCIFGISSIDLLSDTGYPWLITSTEIKKHTKIFLVGTKVVINEWMKQYSMLVQYIPSTFTAALRWLKWSGFKVGPGMNIGHGGTDIHEVTLRRNSL